MNVNYAVPRHTVQHCTLLHQLLNCTSPLKLSHTMSAHVSASSFYLFNIGFQKSMTGSTISNMVSNGIAEFSAIFCHLEPNKLFFPLCLSGGGGGGVQIQYKPPSFQTSCSQFQAPHISGSWILPIIFLGVWLA